MYDTTINKILSLKEKHRIKEILLHSENKPEKIITLVEDLVRKKILKSEKKYEELINNLYDVVMSVDLKGKISYVNSQINVNFGYQKNEVVGHSIFEFIHPDDLPFILKNFKILLQGNSTLSAEYRARNKEGVYVWVRSRGKILDYRDHKVLIGTMRNIDEERKIFEKLKESEQQYRELFESSRDGIAMTNLDGKITECNQAFLDMLGYSKEEITQKSYEDITVTKWHKMEENIIQTQVMKRGYSDEYEKEYIKKEGEIFPINIKTWTRCDKSGKIIGLWAIVRDITEKKRVQNFLKESKEKLRQKTEEQKLLLDNIQTQVWYLTDPFTYGGVNEAHARFNGVTKKDLSFKNLFEIFPHDVAEVCKKGNLEVFNLKKQIHTEEWVPHYSGKRRLISITKTPKLNENGDVEYVICSAEDITEQKRYEKKLKESQEKYRDIAELLPDIIYETNNKGYLTYLNSIGYEKFGFKEETLSKGIHLLDLISEEYKEEAKNEIRKLLRREVTEPKKYLIVGKNSTPFYALIHSRFILKEDRVIGLRGTISDITKMVLAQKKIKESEKKLKKLNELKSELLSRTSHELKTPLVAIKGFTELLLEFHSKKLDKDAFNMLNEIKKGCRRLENLVINILNTERLESGKLEITKTQINLSKIINSAANSLLGLAKSRNQSLSIDVDRDLIIKGQREKILEMIENLLSNAIKYTPPGGKIVVNSKKSDNNIIVSIKDNGIGFTEDEMGELFTKFGKIERYGEGYDINTDGSGLGLFISKKIIQLHGGKIWVESDGRNRGSIFRFSLPLLK
ncbi:MAG: putative Histidine kinase [Promethearchaeota archaeon]|nr:MAG: putative Histidine kinase [Candidatus Lokiarchaeota archaeon]